MSGRTRFAVAAAAIALVLGLAGCAAGASVVENYAGGPHGIAEDQLKGETQAFYIEDAGAIAVVLWGSSTCPQIGERMVVEKTADEGNVVRVDVRPIPNEQPCTRDLVPHTSVFVTPSSVTTTQPLTIRVGDTEVKLVNEVTD